MFGDLTSSSWKGVGGRESTWERGEWKFGTAKEAAGKKGARRMSEGVGAGGRKDRSGRTGHVCRAIGR